MKLRRIKLEHNHQVARRVPITIKARTERKPSCPTTGHPEVTAPSELVTRVEARVDVGFGNTLFIRGQGDGLSWDKGEPLSCIDSATWVWSTKQARDKVTFKLLLNDQVWSKGEDGVVEAGGKVEVAPGF